MSTHPSDEVRVASGSRVRAMSRRARWIWLTVSLSLLAVIAVVNRPGGTHLTGPVVRIVDGDTIDVQLRRRTERVRYAGISTLATPPGATPGGPDATEANRRLVGGKTVKLELDVQDRDQHGRLLAYVWVGDQMVNAELVRLGWAQVMPAPPNVRHQDLFAKLQREAREQRRGLWAEPSN